LDELDGRVVSNFIFEALRSKPITVYGDGSQTRSFCYIDDQIEGLVKLMNSKEFVGPINIGNPYEITVKTLSTIVLELTGSKSEITYMQLPSDDPKKRNPDIRKAKKYLDWEPKFSLEEGLKQTIVYFRELYEEELQNLKNPESTSVKK
jgi:UDP-glucuronate decarboxylase